MTTPHKLPLLPPKLDYTVFIEELTAAHRALAGLDALLAGSPNPRIFERTFVTKEAVLSSRIEGTIATISEVLDYDAGADIGNMELREDALEIINYRKALIQGITELREKPLGENLIKQLHTILLNSARGANRSPGDFRKSQVYIGRPGAGIDSAAYVPPGAGEVIPLIQNLLKYIHEEPERDELVRIAVAHYQFEAIHPFLDGNGRVGRLLITLLLQEKGLLAHPYLYLSEYFEANRQEYYEGLRNVSYYSKWEAWIAFFLQGIADQATVGTALVKEVAQLHKSLQKHFVGISNEYGLALLDAVFQRPIFTVAMLREQAGLTNVQTSYTLVEKLLAGGVIKDLTPHKQRGKRYEFSELLRIVRGGQ